MSGGPRTKLLPLSLGVGKLLLARGLQPKLYQSSRCTWRELQICRSALAKNKLYHCTAVVLGKPPCGVHLLEFHFMRVFIYVAILLALAFHYIMD